MAERLRPEHHNLKGGLIAIGIMAIWAVSLISLLVSDMSSWPWWSIPMAIFWQMMLYTGLFITAHDAMHRTVTPGFPRINDAIGRLAVGLYALFSYRRVRRSHWGHHDHPVSDADPDFHGQDGGGPARWYLGFMVEYLSLIQLLGMAVVFNLLQHLAGIAVVNLMVFWVLPAVLSTVQLFYFGTYLPHREPGEGYEEPHRATSSDYPTWLSFLTCYHFGYHREHHERPDLPWWRLPTYRQQHQH